ncbi:MAG TPA: hypothetical protein VN918_04295 [Myxococcaceae bacterium]|nr:hypothetical protein [Myxococcaceae bacterium]
MRQRPRPSPMQDLYEEKLSARIADLELRIRLLEARFRASAAEERRRALESGKAVKAVPPRPRPRCPGCLLESPPGRRGDSCVWCGFRFEAVKARVGR